MTVTREEMLEVLRPFAEYCRKTDVAQEFGVPVEWDPPTATNMREIRALAALYTRLQSEAARLDAAEELAKALEALVVEGHIWYSEHYDKARLALASYRTANQEREVK